MFKLFYMYCLHLFYQSDPDPLPPIVTRGDRPELSVPEDTPTPPRRALRGREPGQVPG